MASLVGSDNRVDFKKFLEEHAGDLKDSPSISALKKAEKFFRHQQAQTKYQKDKGETEGGYAADHILSTGIVKYLLTSSHATNMNLKYDFNWFQKIKVNLNQCWNFQLLSKKKNREKATVEVRFIKMIRDVKPTEWKNGKGVLALVKEIHKNFQENGFMKFKGLKGLRSLFNWVFGKFELKKIEFTNDKDPCGGNCGACKSILAWSTKVRKEAKIRRVDLDFLQCFFFEEEEEEKKDVKKEDEVIKKTQKRKRKTEEDNEKKRKKKKEKEESSNQEAKSPPLPPKIPLPAFFAFLGQDLPFHLKPEQLEDKLYPIRPQSLPTSQDLDEDSHSGFSFSFYLTKQNTPSS